MIDVFPSLSLRDSALAISNNNGDNINRIGQVLNINRKRFVYDFNYGRFALMALIKIQGWKKVGIPVFTCPVIPLVVKNSGALPVYLDVDKDTWNIDPAEIEQKEQLDAVVVVHTFGQVADIEKIRKTISPKTRIVEDCAQAISGKNLQNGDYQIYSFYKQVANSQGAILVSNHSLAFNFGKNIHDTFPLVNLQIGRSALNLIRTWSPLPSGGSNLIQPTRSSILSQKLFLAQVQDIFRDRQQRVELVNLYRKFLSPRYFTFQSGDDNSAYFNFSCLIRGATALLRNKILITLRANNIFLDRLWYNSLTPSKSFGTILKDTIINLPLNSGVKYAEVPAFCSYLEQLTRETLHV